MNRKFTLLPVFQAHSWLSLQRFFNLPKRVVPFLFLLLLAAVPASAQNQIIIAQDSASIYAGNWTNGSIGGFGFGNWIISTQNNAGAFIGNPASGGISGMNLNSFALYANPAGSNSVSADRSFSQPLPVGATLSFQWGVNFDSNGPGNKGVNIYTGGTGGTQLININMGGSATITINDANMFTNYGTNAMTLNFERTAENQLRVYGTGRDGSETYNQSFTISGAPDAIRFYASNLADNNAQRQPYFNNLQIAFLGINQPPNNISVSGIIIEVGSTLDLEDKIITITNGTNGGFFRNNGTFNSGTSTVIFKAYSRVRGNNQSVFHYAVVDGDDIDFGPYTLGVPKSVIKAGGTLEIRSGNVVQNGAPELAEYSRLYYRTGGTYSRIVEWNNPWDVQIGHTTTLNLNLTQYNNDLPMRGNLTIDENSSVTVDNDHAFDFYVDGNIQIDGTLTLQATGSAGSFSDLFVGGDLNRPTSGIFNHNTREIVFNGPGDQTFSGINDLPYVRIKKTGGFLNLLEDFRITTRLALEQGLINTGDYAVLIENDGTGAIIAGAGNDDFSQSYIVGNLNRRVQHQENNVYHFPVGTAASGQLATITFTNNPGKGGGDEPIIRASYTADAPADVTIAPPLVVLNQTLTQRLNYGTWTLSSQNLNGYEVDLTLTGRSHTNGGPEGSHTIIKSDGSGSWELPGNHEGSSGNLNGPVTAIISGVTDLSFSNPYVIARSDEPLPIELLAFTAHSRGDRVALHWTTASEVNNDYFTLERSADGRLFEPIAFVSGAGSSHRVLHYHFDDLQPLHGISYYRLKQTDFDGQFEYVGLVDVLHDPAGSNKLLVEGPYYRMGQVWFNVQHPFENDIVVQVFEINGRLLHREMIQPGIYTLPRGLGRGMVLVRFSCSQWQETRRVAIP